MNITSYNMEMMDEQKQQEENEVREQKYIVKEMMADSYVTFFEDNGDGGADEEISLTVDDEAWLTEQARLRAEEEEQILADERNHKHHFDATHGL